MSEEESVDIEQELDNLLTKVQPNLQDVIKRSFTNVALQQTKNGEQKKPDTLEDTSYFAKNTQVNLSRLELVKSPMFHMQAVSLDLKSMGLVLRCSLGEVNVKGIYSAFNENLYNLIPVMSEGHFIVSLSNMTADVNVGLFLDEDAFSFANPGIQFTHDEVLVKLSWPSPQRNGGYEFTTTEQLAKHIDDLPLTAAISLPLYALLRQKLQRHLAQALRQATSVSDLMCCNPSLLEAFSDMVTKLAQNGNKVIDMVLINMRRTLLQTCREVLQLPPIHATFLHKNLATINRINDVSVTRPDPMKTCFHVTLRIKDLQIGYDEYRIKAMGASCSGRLAAAFTSNALHMAITVGLARWEPYAQLDDLRLQHCDAMDLHVTGLGPLSGLAGQVRAWARGAAAAHAAPALHAQLQHELHAALADLPLWNMLHANT
ncbi:uncharacterized protein LOC126371837 isoform X2 [Pectinophora gossypiella]|uniref:uncharacterized protein LOC126371837 isoform X2 n=1 Tax=Pectinophora gossypiella TaxID=13191 RepID=UPI00214F4928|nr:uncharacterized protein LOC126371837 isoform X2 [Pectinophora gossypiella]